MDETHHGLTPRNQGFGSEQENQSNQRSTQTTPAPVLGLRTASYCTENEGTPNFAGDSIGQQADDRRLSSDLFLEFRRAQRPVFHVHLNIELRSQSIDIFLRYKSRDVNARS